MGNRKGEIQESLKNPKQKTEYLEKLGIDDTVISHTIHSLLHLRDKQGLLVVRPDMSVTDLHKANFDWLQAIIEAFEKKRAYQIKPESITEGVYWFLWGYKKK